MSPQIIIVPNQETMGQLVALLIVKGINNGWLKVLGCATGNTPKPVYKVLRRMYEKGEVSFISTIFFNLDEYISSPENPFFKMGQNSEASFASFMKHYLFDHTDAQPENCHIPNPFVCSSEQEIDQMCQTYEIQIKEAGGIDLQLLGLGPFCHIAFNFPGSSENSRTRKVKIDGPTREANKYDFGNNPNSVPVEAVTMGLATICEAQRKIVMVTGKHKAEDVRDFVEGQFSINERPAIILRNDPRVLVVLDEAAASLLDNNVGYPRWDLNKALVEAPWETTCKFFSNG